MNKRIAKSILERMGVVQRAFQIAKSGTVTDTSSLHAQLAVEGYLNNPQILAGRSVSRQLARMIVEARRPEHSPGGTLGKPQRLTPTLDQHPMKRNIPQFQ